jgi:hypothetical protein
MVHPAHSVLAPGSGLGDFRRQISSAVVAGENEEVPLAARAQQSERPTLLARADEVIERLIFLAQSGPVNDKFKKYFYRLICERGTTGLGHINS